MALGFSARLNITITPSDVGKRVTTRRRVPEGFRDAVGELEFWRDGVLGVRRRNGVLVEIDEETLAAAKVVPESPRTPHPRA
ncbi:putative acetyltransferase [Streptosporangium sp. OZ121]|uniref:putative acetyltransferase n=1 Tax=Streptosporangium sp. OZ121 TaxID=3444183 RepID=UPI003F7A831D